MSALKSTDCLPLRSGCESSRKYETQIMISQNMILHQCYVSVILTLSSDEDEENPGRGSGGLGSGSASGSPRSGGHSHPEPVNHKEPIITADMENFEDSEKDDTGAVTGEYIDAHIKYTLNIWLVGIDECIVIFFM